MIVTNIEGTLKPTPKHKLEGLANGRKQVGFYMNGYLVSNLLGILNYLAQDWDCVGIGSGHGKVRMGKSTIMFQVATFIAWLLAGGWIDMELVDIGNKRTWKINKIINPTKPIRFNLQDNVVFSAQELRSRATKLFEKHGKNQIIVYDEGREGLDAKRAMENLNKVMEDFFQECGQYGHIILIVLPNYFKLHEDYAVSRSIFLIDCFADKFKKRGYFNFYDEKQKEWLFFLGKKKIGITQKYSAANSVFWGRFTSWFPFDRTEYNRLKSEALKKRQRTARQMQWKKQRDCMIYLYKRDVQATDLTIADELSAMTGDKINDETVRAIIASITKREDVSE
jgi:hypothetical protein